MQRTTEIRFQFRLQKLKLKTEEIRLTTKREADRIEEDAHAEEARIDNLNTTGNDGDETPEEQKSI